jgi:hypothetical protein
VWPTPRQLLLTAVLGAVVGALVALLWGCDLSILHPPTGPGTAYPCGLHAHQCSDGMCCGDGFECSVDRLPIYADPPGQGSCVWGGPP